MLILKKTNNWLVGLKAKTNPISGGVESGKIRNESPQCYKCIVSHTCATTFLPVLLVGCVFPIVEGLIKR